MQNIWQHIYAAFIEADRWKLYLKGLGVTLEVSFFAALLGILIGTIAAFLKLSTRKNGSKTIASRIASAYIDIIRGTPTTVQLLIEQCADRQSDIRYQFRCLCGGDRPPHKHRN